jgi:hypothetical protein
MVRFKNLLSLIGETLYMASLTLLILFILFILFAIIFHCFSLKYITAFLGIFYNTFFLTINLVLLYNLAEDSPFEILIIPAYFFMAILAILHPISAIITSMLLFAINIYSILKRT